MLKKLGHFMKEYRALSFVILAIGAGLLLDFVFRKHTAAHIVLGATSVLMALPMLKGMYEDIRSGKFGIDILAITAIAASVIMHEYWAGMVIILMLTGGEALEDYAENRAKSELTLLMSRVPQTAHVVKNNKVVDVKVENIEVKDIIQIKPGEIVPVDAVITNGVASFDESSLTGEPLPVEKKVGDEISSGTVNNDALITARVLRASNDSQYQQIVKLVKQASNSEAPFVRMADKYSIGFTITSFAIAFAAWGISGEALRFLQVLVVATPCPFLLGAPIAMISGMSRAAKHGVIIKTGTALEKLAHVKTVAFDKTGTLTIGHPSLDKVVSLSKLKKDEVLHYAASLEQNSNHVLARAVVMAAEDKGLKFSKVKRLSETAGHGLSGTLDGREVMVGKFSFIKQQGASIPKTFDVKSVSQTASFVSVNHELVGYITYIDEVRPESKTTIGKLRQLGIKHVLMLTGDNAKTAKTIASSVGITEVKADCSPEDKLLAIKELEKSYRPSLMVGDGINDAPVLVAADIGIAMGAKGATAASESADAVIMLEDIGKVEDAVRIAKRTFFIAKQSIIIGIVISLGLMLVFATGKFSPTLGAGLQEVVDVAVIINALRAHGAWTKKKTA